MKTKHQSVYCCIVSITDKTSRIYNLLNFEDLGVSFDRVKVSLSDGDRCNIYKQINLTLRFNISFCKFRIPLSQDGNF